jgi:predicted aspartyl protease
MMMIFKLAGVTVLCAATTASPAPIFGTIDNDGGCIIDAIVNGKPMQFMVDTAVDDLFLSRLQAYRIGIDPLKMDVDTDDDGNKMSSFTVSLQIGDFSDSHAEAVVEIKDHEVDLAIGRLVLSHFKFQMSAKSCELDPQ